MITHDAGDESARLAALARYDVLDTAPEAAFDMLTRLAAHICGTPIAMISLVDEERQWFKSSVGLDFQEMPRNAGFCPIVVHNREPLVIADALKDQRFASNPVVTSSPHVRSYAGVPLMTPEGHILGTLCVAGRAPQRLSEEKTGALVALARETMIQLELRRENSKLRPAQERLELILEAAGEGIIGLDKDGRVMFVNPAAATMLGWEEQALRGHAMHEAIHHSHADGTPYPKSQCRILAALGDGEVHRGYEEVFWRKDGSAFPVSYTSTPMLEEGKLAGTVVVFRDVNELKATEQALRDSEAQLRLITDSAPALICYVDAERRYRFNNLAYEEWLGCSRDDLYGKHLREALGDDAFRQIAPYVERALAGHRVSYEAQFSHRSGESRHFSATYIPDQCETGDVKGLVALIEDITERKRADEERNRFFTLPLHLLCVADMNGYFKRVNPSFEKTLGYTEEELLTKPFIEFVYPEDREATLEEYEKVKNNSGSIHFENRYRRKDGSLRWLTWASYVALEEGLIFGVALDITERKRAEERLSHLANYDDLTTLPNRVLCMDRLTHALTQTPRHKGLVAVLFVDLDRFKNVNDSLGHEVGDLLLKAVAARLVGCLRESDTVARLSGDEFAVILPEVAQPADAEQIAAKLVNALHEPFQIAQRDLFVTASIGISLYPKDGEDARTLLKNADTAMYHAKEKGRNHFKAYTGALGSKASRRLDLENGLRRALARDEFMLHYQPQIELASGRIEAVEALLRWQRHGSDRQTPTDEFIPLAEDTGLIVPIGAWVLRTACEQYQAWQAQGIAPNHLAVNFSARQFHHLDGKGTIEDMLKESGCDASVLELELTESILQTVEAEMLLRGYQQGGLRIAIDDFGTGYSSLSYLKRFPVNKVKIDRSFVHGVTANPDNVAIIKAIIAMACSLNLRVTAEGVETAEQLETVRVLGCDAAQGFLLGKPMAAEETTRLLKDKHGDAAS